MSNFNLPKARQMKSFYLLLFCFLFYFQSSSQSIQNTKWQTYNSALSDTVTVEVKIDTIHQYRQYRYQFRSFIFWIERHKTNGISYERKSLKTSCNNFSSQVYIMKNICLFSWELIYLLCVFLLKRLHNRFVA